MTRYTIYYYEIILLMTFALFCVGKKNPLISLLCFFMFLREILIYICGIHFYYFTRLLIFFVYFSLIRMIYCFILISVNFQLFESKSLIIYKPNSRIYIRLSFICLFSFCFIFWYSYNHLSPLLSHKTMLNNDFNSALLYIYNDLLIYQHFFYNLFYSEIVFFGILFFLLVNIFLLFCLKQSASITIFETNFLFTLIAIKCKNYFQNLKYNSVIEWGEQWDRPKKYINKRNTRNCTLKPVLPRTAEEWQKLSQSPEDLKKLWIAYDDLLATLKYTFDIPKMWYFFVLFSTVLFLFYWIYLRYYSINIKFITLTISICTIFFWVLSSTDFLIRVFGLIRISLFQVFFLFIDNNPLLIRQAPRYVIYTCVSSVFILIGTVGLCIYCAPDLENLWLDVNIICNSSIILQIRSIFIMIGLSMKRGVFPFSFYHIPVYQLFSPAILFFSQSILKFIYRCFFLKFFAILFPLNPYYITYFLIFSLLSSLMYSTIRALTEKSFNLIVLFSGFSNFRFFLMPFTANNLRKDYQFFNFSPLMFGCRYLLCYIFGILRLFYFRSQLDLSTNIADLTKISNFPFFEKLKYIMIIIFLSGFPPSLLFFGKVKILFDVFRISSNYVLVIYRIFLSAVSRYYYLNLLRFVNSQTSLENIYQKKVSKLYYKFDYLFRLTFMGLIYRNIQIFIVGVRCYEIWFSRIICYCIMNPRLDRRSIIWM